MLITGGVLALGAGALYAAASYRSLREEMQRSLTGVGHATGLSVDGLDGLARSSAAQTGLGVSASRANAMTLAATGRFDPSNLTGILGLTKGYAGAFGTSYAEAGSKLADIFADPVKGADELNKRLGFLDDATREYIKSLVAQGDQQGAVAVAINAATPALNEQVQRTGLLSQFWKNVADDAERFRNALAKAQSGPTDMETYVKASETSDFGTLLGHLRGWATDDGSVDAAENIRNAVRLRAQQQTQTLSATSSQQVGDIVRGLLPELTRSRKAEDDLSLLRKALGNQDTLDALSRGPAGLAPGQVQQAYTSLTVRTGANDPDRKAQQDYELSLAAADAFSVAEKGAVEARRAELAVLRETGDVSRAATAAQMAMNEAIAKSNSDAEDRLGLAKQEASYVGLTSYQRRRQQLIDSFEGYGGQFEKDRASKSDIAEAWKPVATDLRSAGHEIAEAIRAAAAGLTSGAAPSGAIPGSAPILGSSNFGSAVSRTLGFEGGLNPRDTNGTPSRFGINAAANPGVDLGTLTSAGAASIYKTQYWDKVGADKMDPALARIAFDTAVMEGVGQALKLVGQSGGNANKLLDLRQSFEASLLDRNPVKYGPYASAWAARDAGLRSDINGGAASNPTSARIASTALGKDKQVLESRVSALDKGEQQDPIDEANRALDNQNRLLDVQYETLGRTTSQIQGTAAAQSLMNHYLSEHITITPAMEASIKAIGDRTAETAQRTADFARSQQQLTAVMDGVRSGFGDGLHTFVEDLEHGKSAGSAFRDVMSGLGKTLQNAGLNAITSSLFGQQGKPGGGLFGGGLGSIFGSLMGGGSGGFQGWWGGSAFAAGGVMSASGPLPLRKHAGGGVASSPQLAMFGEGAHNEAYVPLADGRSIPVSMRKPAVSQSAQAPAQINVNGHTIIIQGNADKDTVALFDQKLAAAKAEQIKDLQRNFGRYQGAFSKRYG